MKKLVQQKILYFQGFSATLFLHSRTICGQVLRQVGNQVPFHRHAGGAPGEARGGGGLDPGGPIHEVGIESRGLDLVLRQVPGQLVDNGADHLQVPQFLGPQRAVKMCHPSENQGGTRLSGAVHSQKRECANSGIPVFHGGRAVL